jgi:hypothetical protein
MEQQTAYQFDEDEIKTLKEALALYAGYTREMEVNMLVGDESDADEVRANHQRALDMYKELFEEVEGETFEQARQEHSDIIGRPADINDFSTFDWHEYVRKS